jgi:hypothetical protein
MPYTYTNSKGQIYALHRKDTPLSDGRTRTLHYFSRDLEGAIDELPAGYVVAEARTGMPLLKKRP